LASEKTREQMFRQQDYSDCDFRENVTDYFFDLCFDDRDII
jgi:hypothetical protein